MESRRGCNIITGGGEGDGDAVDKEREETDGFEWAGSRAAVVFGWRWLGSASGLAVAERVPFVSTPGRPGQPALIQ